MPATGKGASGAGKAGKSKAAPAKRPKPIVEQKAALIDIAELLQGVALESCGRHHRYSALVKRGAAVSEQKAALAAVRECDEILDEAVDLYQLVCLEETNHADDAWWHKANMVWRAAKEYLRHNVASRRSTRLNAPSALATLPLVLWMITRTSFSGCRLAPRRRPGEIQVFFAEA
jgi:hypothetical protein